MPRLPLDLGTHGKITCYQEANKRWRALTIFRDYDGVTRRVSRRGKSSAAAQRELKGALKQRSKVPGAGLGSDSKVREVADKWLQSVQHGVDVGNRSPTTVDQYRSNLHRNVLPALGELRVREVTVPIVDAFLTDLRLNKSASTAKTSRSIVSGILSYAVRHGAAEMNVTRETSRIERGRVSAPRALTLEERIAWLDHLERNTKAVRWDLPDLSRFMLATGVRVGEALAVLWPELDFDTGTVRVDHNVVRVKGHGLVRKSTKTEQGERTLRLPSWAVEMLRRRYDDTDDLEGPVFPNSLGGLRDASNTLRVLRATRGTEFSWVTSHVFRKTAATILDEAGLSARMIADQLGHSRPSMTQDVYMGRKVPTHDAAAALEGSLED